MPHAVGGPVTPRCRALRVSGPWRGWQCGNTAGHDMDGYCGIHFGQLCADPKAFKVEQGKAKATADRGVRRH
jgi:hypothetical protein